MVCYGNWGSPKTMRALNPLCNKDADEDIYSVECFCHSKSSDKAACDNQSKCTWDDSTDDAMKCKSAFGNRASADITWHDGYCNNPEGGNGLLQVADTTNALRLNKGRRLRGFRKPHSLLQTQGVTDVASEFAGQMLLSYLEKGNLSQAICIGKDEFCRANDDLRTIAGEFGTSLHPKHGAELKLHVPVIKAGAVAYLATSAVSKTVGEGVLDALDFVGVANLGIQDVNMSIASNGGSITLQASGSPYLGSRETKGFFQKQIKKAAEHVVLQTTATYFVGGGGAEFETRFGTKPIVVKKDRCIIRDQTGKLGPSFFTRTKYASGTTRNEVGATVGFDICVDDCTKPTRRFINLQGELLVAQTAVATTLSGELAMNGWWSNAFGSKMLNIGDLKFRLGLDMKTAPPVPTELELGGRVCLGKKEVCVDKTEKSGNYINALAYGGFSVTDPNQNYFLGMLSETTLDKVFAVLGDTMSPKYHSWRKQLPSKIMNSGLYPVKTDCTEQQALSPGLFPECFVRIAVAPSAAKQVKTSDGYITVRKGFSMSGRLNVAGFEVRAEAAISPTSYFVDVNMDPINIANIISITASEKDGGNFVPLSGGNDNKARNLQACIGECDSDIQCAAGLKCFQRNAYENIPGCVGAGNKGWDYCYNPKKTSVAIEKGPRFMIDLRAVPPTAAIDITGRIDIPKLNTYGDVLVKLNDEGFKLSTETKLFGFMQSNLDAWWSWDMKTNPQLGFRAALQDVSFAGVMEGVVDIIEDQIDKAFEFLDKVEGEMRKITSYLNNICKSLYDKKKIKKSIYLLCKPAAKTATGIVKGAFSIAKGALEAAKRAIERLIDIAMKGMKAVEDIFYIKKLSVSGFVDGSFSNSRVGAEIAVKLFKKDQKPLILDLDLSDSNKWIANAATKIWNGIKSTLKDIADLAKKAEKEFNKIKNAVSDAFKDAGKEIADWFGNIAKQAAKAVAKAAKKAAKKVGKALRRF